MLRYIFWWWKNRTAQARLLGYENYVELGYYRMNRNSYGREDVENFRRQIKEYFVSLAEKMHDKRRERLGLEKLSYIDENMYFVDGNPKPQGTPEEIMANGQKMYEKEIYRAIISAAVLCQWIAEHDTPPTDGEAEELAREIDRRLCEAWGEIFSLAVLEWRDGQ